VSDDLARAVVAEEHHAIPDVYLILWMDPDGNLANLAIVTGDSESRALATRVPGRPVL